MRTLAAALAVCLTLASAHADPLSELRLEDLSTTRERPLFRPSRRPPPPAPVAQPEAPATPVETPVVASEPPPFDLVGAAVGKRDAIALLRNRARGEVVRLRRGEEAEGWRAVSIGLRSVTLERDGRTESLALSAPATAAAQIAGEPQPSESANAPPVADLKRMVHGRPEH